MLKNKTEPIDLAIIGSGIAALSAAIYTARDKISPVLFENKSIGGITGTISKIENFPGFEGSGVDLINIIRRQAKNFGAKIKYAECTSIEKTKDLFRIVVDDQPILARSVLVATGSERRRLAIPGEDLPGISYCATCDGPLVQDKDIVVIGGGDAAVQEALYLLKYCKSLTLVSRSPLRCTPFFKEKLSKEPRIKLRIGLHPLKITQIDQRLILNFRNDTSSLESLSADFLFIFIGMTPATHFLPSEILDEEGYIKAGANFETAIPGLFTAGDCRHGSVKQSIVAAGEAAAAAIHISKYLASRLIKE